MLWNYYYYSLILISESSATTRPFRLAKKENTIKYGYRKCGTHAQVFSQSFPHGNSKNKIRQIHRGRMSEEKREYGWKYSEYEKKSSDDETVARAYRPLMVAIPGKLWMNYLRNLTYSYNQNTASWEGCC